VVLVEIKKLSKLGLNHSKESLICLAGVPGIEPGMSVVAVRDKESFHGSFPWQVEKDPGLFVPHPQPLYHKKTVVNKHRGKNIFP
jgi:hypothetical protein